MCAARNRRNSGTYLFVREDAKPRDRESRPSVSSERPRRKPLVSDSMLQPLEPATSARLRHRRARPRPERVDPRLVFFTEPRGETAEAYRELARRVVEAGPADKRLMLSAPLRGAGTTLTTLNLACALAESQRVTVVDLHLEAPGVAAALGLEGEGLTEIVRARRRDPRSPIDLVLVADGLTALPAGAVEGNDLAFAPELARVLEEVACAADLVLIDAPPVLEGAGLEGLRGLARSVVLVTRAGELGSGAYERALEALAGQELLGALVNGAPEGGRRPAK